MTHVEEAQAAMVNCAESLKENFLLSSVVVLAVDQNQDGSEALWVARGGHFEQIGLLQSVLHKLLTGNFTPGEDDSECEED